MRLDAKHYPTVLMTAVVSGVFSVVVCALLLADYARRSATLPLDLPEFQSLKAELVRQPEDEDLRQQIRAVDLRLRAEYFRQRRFAYRGAYLLAGGLALTLISGRLAVSLRRKLPMPMAVAPGDDPAARVAARGRWAVAGLVILLASAAVTVALSVRSPLPTGVDELARRTPPSAPARPGGPVADTAGRAAATVAPARAAAKSARLAEPVPPEQVARNWPRFRGPHGAGHSAYSNVPTTWNAARGDGIVWRTPVPLPGHNSPVVWNDCVFLTGATADRREVYCFDAQTGKLRWRKNVPATGRDSGSTAKVGEDTGYAAPTAATDGHRVFAIFATGDLAAFDFAGKAVWSVHLGTPKNVYGYASSLTTFGGLVIVQFDQGTAKDNLSKLVALDATTGKIVWQTARAVPNSWTTPIVIGQGGQARIITSADPWVIAYQLRDGAEIWRAKCLRQDVGPSPVFAAGMVYVASEFPCVSAIRAGGRGDVTKTHIKWTADAGLPDTCSPLVAGPLLLLLASYGTLTCYDAAKGGDPLWEQDFDDSFCSSPSLAGTRVYLFGQSGKSWVIEPGRDGCREVAQGDLGQSCVTSPAFQEGRIYIRGEKHLFCLGNQ